jgi:hypothetical protein
MTPTMTPEMVRAEIAKRGTKITTGAFVKKDCLLLFG